MVDCCQDDRHHRQTASLANIIDEYHHPFLPLHPLALFVCEIIMNSGTVIHAWCT
jgi:hypothetical protein